MVVCRNIWKNKGQLVSFIYLFIICYAEQKHFQLQKKMKAPIQSVLNLKIPNLYQK